MSAFGLFLYVGVGFVFLRVGRGSAQYPFLSVTRGPILNVVAIVFAVSDCLSMAPLIVATTVSELKSHRSVRQSANVVVLLASFIGLGFGISILRYTLPITLKVIRKLTPL